MGTLGQARNLFPIHLELKLIHLLGLSGVIIVIYGFTLPLPDAVVSSHLLTELSYQMPPSNRRSSSTLASFAAGARKILVARIRPRAPYPNFLTISENLPYAVQPIDL